ncbi:PEPxxWA-CTERM sorting domain-containing protein [Phenylobacterium sp.]|uniref:PEPxxWA-CTERM sorting domain-containing protein n=1 Tax=Phenylobacterium sp. TaxID=1871053 RepID=UPI00374D3B39
MKRLISITTACAMLAAAGAANAGKVYLTGHDPDFHAQGQLDGQIQLQTALNYVTGGTYNNGTTKFLWVESNLAATSGHLVGFNGLTTVGVGAGNVDRVDAAGFAGVNLNSYSAIVVASTFGGMLTSAEINAMIARSGDIAAYINAGHGLAAFAECFQTAACNGSNTLVPTTPFGYLPITVTSVDTVAPYHVTAFGASLGLTDDVVSDCCTHNSFSAIGGLNIVDLDQENVATTLAGDVTVGTGGLSGTPEPATWAMMLMGFGGLGAVLRHRRVRAFTA